ARWSIPPLKSFARSFAKSPPATHQALQSSRTRAYTTIVHSFLQLAPGCVCSRGVKMIRIILSAAALSLALLSSSAVDLPATAPGNIAAKLFDAINGSDPKAPERFANEFIIE